MATNTPKNRWHFMQRRSNATVDHLRPQRWNWTVILRPLDRGLAKQAVEPLPFAQVRSLRFFWLDGLFAAISDNFYVGFVTLYALAYGASNGQVGWLTAVANLAGALALFPGARLIERVGRRKPVVVWSGGGVARLTFLAFAFFPFFITQPQTAILCIVILEGTRAFMANLANPAWTAMVADLVPMQLRGRYLGSRNLAMGVAALVVAPLAGRIISLGNNWGTSHVTGYQVVFILAFIFGMISTLSYQRIDEPEPSAPIDRQYQRGALRQTLRHYPWFIGLVISAFVWNMSLQVAGPFFNVYLVNEMNASAAMIGLLAAVSSLTALLGQQVFGRLLDSKGTLWVQQVCGFLIPVLPIGWMFITAPWHVIFINTLGGFIWAGYSLSNFNLLLTFTPEEQRPRAVALYQTAVFGSAVIGPLLGGYLADAISYKLIFALSGIGRLSAMVLFMLFTVRPYQRQENQKI
ncbi:MAG: MFS transporter [Chloroflexota bacterium]